MQKVINKMMCLVFGHSYESKVELNRTTESIYTFYQCTRCGKKSISMYG